MGIWGKIIGGVAGMAMGGPFGALLGTAAGHAFDRMRGEFGDLGEAAARAGGGVFGPYADQARRIAFTVSVVVLAAKMSKAVGGTGRDEFLALRRLFSVEKDEVEAVDHVFFLARASPEGYEPYARQAASLFADRPEMLEEILDALFAIAQADGVLSEVEREFLDQVAAIFGMPERDFDRVAASHTGGGDPYQVLGVSREASLDDIRVSYRRLLREHHPDTLMGRGLPEEFIAIATRKMAAINAAFDTICRERGERR